MWLPLLASFIWLTWAGWNEFQKVQAYQIWAKDFDHHKFDIYAVLGHKENNLTWGIPTHSYPRNLQTISLSEIDQIQLEINSQFFNSSQIPQDLGQFKSLKKIEINLSSFITAKIYKIPFTDLAIASSWLHFLEGTLPPR